MFKEPDRLPARSGRPASTAGSNAAEIAVGLDRERLPCQVRVEREPRHLPAEQRRIDERAPRVERHLLQRACQLPFTTNVPFTTER